MAIIRNTYLGSNKISNLAVGDTVLKGAYLGDNLIWGQYCYNLYFINRTSSEIRHFDFFTIPIISIANSSTNNNYTFDNTPYTYLKPLEQGTTSNEFNIVYKNNDEMQTYVYVSSIKPTINSFGNLTLPASYDRYYTATKNTDKIPVDSNYRGGTYGTATSPFYYTNSGPTYIWLEQEKIIRNPSSISCTFTYVDYVISGVQNIHTTGSGATSILNPNASISIKVYGDSETGVVFCGTFDPSISTGNFSGLKQLSQNVLASNTFAVSVSILCVGTSFNSITTTAYQYGNSSNAVTENTFTVTGIPIKNSTSRIVVRATIN